MSNTLHDALHLTLTSHGDELCQAMSELDDALDDVIKNTHGTLSVTDHTISITLIIIRQERIGFTGDFFATDDALHALHDALHYE